MRSGIFIAVAAVVLAGCGHKRNARLVPVPATPNGRVSSAARSVPPSLPQLGDQETGLASWYGYPYHGRAAANGEIYDMETLVAAHRTLPFDTWVRVVNLSNQKAVAVRIVDRGPFVDGRIIDLSHAAARELEVIGPGTVPVRIEVVKVPEIAPAVVGLFTVQVGAFRDRNNAERAKAAMSRYGPVRLVQRPGSDIWRVLVGVENTQDDADALSKRIRQESGEKNAFVVRLES